MKRAGRQMLRVKPKVNGFELRFGALPLRLGRVKGENSRKWFANQPSFNLVATQITETLRICSNICRSYSTTSRGTTDTTGTGTA